MQPTKAGPARYIRWLGVATTLTSIGAVAATGQAPTAAQEKQTVEVPVYPNSKLDAQMSAAMTQGGNAFFVYVTTDPAAKVVAFYTDKTKKKGEKQEDGSFAFFLGGGPLPDLTIQTNLLGEYVGKTVITIAKLKS